MKKVGVRVQKEFCAECSLALMRFMKNMEGIESVEADEGAVSVTFDESKIDGDRVTQIVRENVEKLGYRLER